MSEYIGKLPVNSSVVVHRLDATSMERVAKDPELNPVLLAPLVMAVPWLTNLTKGHYGCDGCEPVRRAVHEFESRGAKAITVVCRPNVECYKDEYISVVSLTLTDSTTPDIKLNSTGGPCEFEENLFRIDPSFRF
jgi:hypothetical protein